MRWYFRAKTLDGELKEGYLDVQDSKDAVIFLKKQGLVVITVEKSQETKGFIQKIFYVKHRISQIGTIPLQERALFFRQASTLLESGIVLGTVLEVLEQQCACPPLGKTISDLKRSVNEGVSLSEALKEHRGFGVIIHSLVQVGEESGCLDRSLGQIAAYLEQQEALRKKILSAVSYPLAVVLFSLIVLWILMTRVLPQFQQIFARMEIPMPALTEKVFRISTWMVQNGLWAVLGGAGTIVFLWILCRCPKVKRFLDPVRLRFPISGSLLRLSVMARGLQTFGFLTASGVPILRALELSSQTADNYEISEGFRSLCDAAVRGESIGTQAGRLRVFPPMVVQMIKVGEESGRLDTMVLKASEWYRQELEERVKKLTSLIEPLLTVVVGFVVLLVAVAVFAPVISAVEMFSR